MADVEVVMLDPRARLARGALDSIRRCAASDDAIGTITPVTVDSDAAIEAVRRAAVPVYPDVATGASPCIAVRRDLLRDGREGIAEMRARSLAAGYRNVLCDDASVVHRMDDGEPLGPVETVGPVRRMIRSQLALVGREDLPGVLHVVHPRGGGTEKHIRELIAASSREYRHYFLRIYPDRWLFKEAGDTYAASYAWPRDAANRHSLRTMSAWLRIDVVHVHSLVGSGDDFLELLDEAGLPYCYTAHDMYLPCPAVYLINSSGAYCNANTDPAVCRQCLAGFGSLGDVDIVQWRERYARFLGKAARVHAPSQWAGETLHKYYPAMRLAVTPHRLRAPRSERLRDDLDVFALPRDECRHIGVLGAIGPEKGARQIEQLGSTIRERRLPLRIVVIGYTDRTMRMQSDDGVLTVHGRYRPDEVETLLDRYGVSLVVFPTIWPETWSYTLAEAWLAGRPALVPPRGALMERVRATGAGWTMERWPDVDALADRLVELTSPGHAAELAAKQALARAAFDAEVREGATASVLYRDLLDRSRRIEPREDSRYAIYEAACRAMGVAPLPMPSVHAPSPAPRETPLRRIARLLRG